jgi:hypothetical protein
MSNIYEERELMENVSSFRLGRSAYKQIVMRSWLMLTGLLSLALVTLVLGIVMWKTYNHHFTLYLKWQDALVALLWFISFLGMGGSIMIGRFLHAVHAGSEQGMITLIENSNLVARDLSSLNLASIFWMLHSTFWCFVAVLLGLVPAILIGWTQHITNQTLMILTTILASLLSLVGITVSISAAVIIAIGCIGAVSFTRKLGAARSYVLNNRTILRIDDFVLTISYPGTEEALVDLNLLDKGDQPLLLLLLHERWIGGQDDWNPEFGEEIEAALHGRNLDMVAV